MSTSGDDCSFLIDLSAFMFVPIFGLVSLRKVDVKDLRAREKRDAVKNVNSGGSSGVQDAEASIE
ncbi:hypothetical protein CC80DRAFT_487031 [Byssothecium circinans]|uniref:Uncharacterized protein n=1 Tax=Byssothecium circinans TaxID=147558 RepID=A0A6A5URI6_9PLEO|nr:hypothetical protein CC80DRAFT_487031 [Byssothecium circinans]